MAGGAALAVIGLLLGIYMRGRHDGAAQERPRVAAAQAQAMAAGLETLGARQTARRVEVVVRQRDAAAAVVSDIAAKALLAEDAHAPLDPDRAARLRDADRRLCDQAALAGCSKD
jgi:hypothetical protein